MKAKIPSALHILTFLLIAQATGAIAGGLALVFVPDGSVMGLPLEPLLRHSPFPDYSIPGAILLLVLGVFPAFTVWALYARPSWHWPDRLNVYRDQHWAWAFSTYVGFGLVIWIAIEILFTRLAHPLQTAYVLLGTAITAWTLLPPIRKHFRKDP